MAAYFIVKVNNTTYVNGELYIDALAKGERSFRKMLANKVVVGKLLFDQVLYPITPEQRKICETYNPNIQDIDSALRYFNIVSKETLRQIREQISEAFFNSHVISINSNTLPECCKYKYFTFFKACCWNYEKGNKYKYHALSKMATVKICGYLYIALNAVDVRVEAPIIASLKD